MDKHGVPDNNFMRPRYNEYPHFFRRLREARPEIRLAQCADWLPIDEKILGPIEVEHRFAVVRTIAVRIAVVAAIAVSVAVARASRLIGRIVVAVLGRSDGTARRTVRFGIGAGLKTVRANVRPSVCAGLALCAALGRVAIAGTGHLSRTLGTSRNANFSAKGCTACNEQTGHNDGQRTAACLVRECVIKVTSHDRILH
jgi:hypothetical protein